MTSLSYRPVEQIGGYESPIGEKPDEHHLYDFSDVETSGTETETESEPDEVPLNLLKKKRYYAIILQEEEFVPE